MSEVLFCENGFIKKKNMNCSIFPIFDSDDASRLFLYLFFLFVYFFFSFKIYFSFLLAKLEHCYTGIQYITFDVLKVLIMWNVCVSVVLICSVYSYIWN